MRRNLQATQHSPAHAARLRLAALTFERWLKNRKLPTLKQLVKDAAKTNEALVEYIQWLRDQHGKVSHGRLAVLAVQEVRPELRGRLARPWDSIRSWQYSQPSYTRAPLPVAFMESLCGVYVLLAFVLQSSRASLWIELL